MAKTKTEIHVTTVFDGELDAADVFVSLIAQKFGQNTGKDNLVKTQDLGHLPMIFDAKWQNFCVRKIPMPMPVQAQGS